MPPQNEKGSATGGAFKALLTASAGSTAASGSLISNLKIASEPLDPNLGSQLTLRKEKKKKSESSVNQSRRPSGDHQDG
jgi:hypothetical protein